MDKTKEILTSFRDQCELNPYVLPEVVAAIYITQLVNHDCFDCYNDAITFFSDNTGLDAFTLKCEVIKVNNTSGDFGISLIITIIIAAVTVATTVTMGVIRLVKNNTWKFDKYTREQQIGIVKNACETAFNGNYGDRYEEAFAQIMHPHLLSMDNQRLKYNSVAEFFARYPRLANIYTDYENNYIFQKKQKNVDQTILIIYAILIMLGINSIVWFFLLKNK